jgi:uncharacterized integral membrane protein
MPDDPVPGERAAGPPPGREGLDERQVRRIALAGASVLVVSLLLIFVIENSDAVQVSFVFFSADISLIWVIVLSAVIGGAVGPAGARVARRRLLDRR